MRIGLRGSEIRSYLFCSAESVVAPDERTFSMASFMAGSHFSIRIVTADAFQPDDAVRANNPVLRDDVDLMRVASIAVGGQDNETEFLLRRLVARNLVERRLFVW